MEFEQRLQKAIQRGKNIGGAAAEREGSQAITEEKYKRLHSQYRLQLSEAIETCVRKLRVHLPGFQFETIFGDRGWGAACKRDDFRITSGKRENVYSRLEMTVRPYSLAHILELTARGTIQNKEVFSRSHFEMLDAVDPVKFLELIDLWVLEYAEQYAAKTS